MISKEILDETILELESKDTTFANCEKLASLYTVRDHIQKYGKEPVSISAAGEFLQAANGKNADSVWRIIDEVMDAVKVLHPKMYEKALQKIKDMA